MRAEGFGPGYGVAMVTSMTPGAFAANLAAHALGCRVVGVRPGWSRPQLAHALGAQLDAVIVDAATATPELRELTGDAKVLSLGPGGGAPDLSGVADDGMPVTAEAWPDDIARLNFTSGSTGRPKGCARTYRTFGLAYRAGHWAPPLARLLTRFERLLVYGSWSMPVMLTFAGRCLLMGGTVVIPDDGDTDDGRPLLPYAIERHRITAALTTVPSLHRMLDVLREDIVDVGSMRALVVSGSPAGPDLLAEAIDLLGPVIWQGYGQGESEMISLLTPADIAAGPADVLSTVGRALPTVEISVRDANGDPASPGETGRIHVRSPHMMAGYWDDPEQTEEVLRDGWLDTRDLGYVDDAGFLRLTGRSRNVIMVNAEVCYAEAIERVLAGHPDVDQACVVGAPDAQTGEAVHAFVVPRRGRTPDRQALARMVRAELTAASVPKTVTVLPGVPVAAGGKPDKSALLSLARRSSSRDDRTAD
jgi:acyl-CoA synthetase (AMP-forming)/AMP-acid ligase II